MIILLADDLGYGDLGCYGHPSIETPCLDRMAAEGQRWTDFYAGATVCGPSRGALMTGQLPVRTGLYGIRNPGFWHDATGGIPIGTGTIARALQDAGYDTAMLGKWHLGDKPDALPTRHGFDSWLGTPNSNDDYWTVDPDLHRKIYRSPDPGKDERLSRLIKRAIARLTDPDRKSSEWGVPLIESRKSQSGFRDRTVQRPADQESLTSRYTDEAVAFIGAHRAGARPFFLYVAFNMPHVPTFASRRFKGKSIRGSYGDAVEELDWSAAEIRHALEETGLANNTLVVFTSDNGAAGPHLDGGSTGPLKGRKGMIFEGGVRVPCICWSPGRIKPAIVHGIGGLIDLYATALSLAGKGDSPPDSLDLTPTFEGKASPREGLLYYSISGELLGYRKNAWKVAWTENGIKPADKTSLYNLNRDPGEAIDLSASYPGLAKRLTEEGQAVDGSIPRKPPLFDQ